ncbi:PilN domain-containing protein [Microvirga soli]|uniref:PilN domain-containing protein n=1 Tax=Microvirga soli TaxID=1854496 RepID=UPI00191CD82B|nr:PilN domain-containing protein [Microvirga soli]
MSGSRAIALGRSSLATLWLREWRTLRDKALRGSSASRRPAHLLLDLDEEQLIVMLREPDGEEVTLDACPPAAWSRERLTLAARSASSRSRGRKVLTVLSCAQAVTGSLFVPQQARSQAEDIIRDHLRRKMPVPLEDLVLGHEIRTAAQGKLELAYLAVPKRQVEGILARLCLRSTDIDALQAPARTHLQPAIVIYNVRARGTKDWVRRGIALLGLVALLAPIGGFGMQAWQQNRILSDLEAQAIAATEQARASTDELKTIYSLAGDLERLTAVGAAPGVVVIWEELARLLPDTSYLSSVEIKGNEVHAEGLSASTSDLIKLIENSQYLHGVSLTGPVVFEREHGKERFTLRALMRTQRFPAGEGG